MRKIKMIVTDLDGTLLNEEHTLSGKAAEILKTASSLGIQILIATGRSWNTASRLLEKTEGVCAFVLLNGAEFRDPRGRLLFHEPIEPESAEKILDYLLEQKIGFEINTERGDFATDTDLCAADPIEKLESFGKSLPVLHKIFVFSESPEKLENARKYFSRSKALTITSSADWNLEITSYRARKGIMVERAAAYYGISKEQILIFGDGENDISMFERFPHTRAMGNALPKLKTLAEKEIGTNRTDSVAYEIQKLLKL
ncbi:MAG TPA: Cof-type HAD-IIB family hydrolase [Candidatus Blautia stercoripullorum]|uniref:Cof-type HAD-IIB family hydrolase n=1 Tax=Candidatus Blautia stercoripullorum TaxID=2838502 RepID=A0A9D2R8H2_9FIRM|nr:Cof-type HAD-IIB family hydrolase [Candidatus Blautia stercoripullorum]